MSGQGTTNEEIIAAAARIVMRAALDLIQVDPHQWSTRPCQTCRAVTAMTGIEFGCVRYTKERGARL